MLSKAKQGHTASIHLPYALVSFGLVLYDVIQKLFFIKILCEYPKKNITYMIPKQF